jgi:hypothetical protein
MRRYSWGCAPMWALVCIRHIQVDARRHRPAQVRRRAGRRPRNRASRNFASKLLLSIFMVLTGSNLIDLNVGEALKQSPYDVRRREERFLQLYSILVMTFDSSTQIHVILTKTRNIDSSRCVKSCQPQWLPY